MVNTELYIIVNGERKKLDLPSPSGITLNFVSNLFNDLSKINASYSYTFKLPRTANNVRMLELADDVRADGKFTKVKNEAEFVYDGVSLFANANMYISGVENDTISVVLTWNVNKGLQELSKHDMSLNELGNHLPEGEYDYVGDEASDYEKDKVVLVGEGVYDSTGYVSSPFYHHLRPIFDKFSDYNPTQPYFRSLHNGGLPLYFDAPKLWYLYDYKYISDSPLYEADNKLSPLEYVQTRDERELKKTPFYYQYGALGEYDNDKTNFPAYAIPAPIVPVPYIMSVIEKVYGIKFGFSGDKYNSLCVPLVSVQQTDALARLNHIHITLSHVTWATCYLRITGTIVNNYPNINPLSHITYPVYGTGEDDWNTDRLQSISFEGRNMRFDTVIDEHSESKIRVTGKLIVTVPGSNRWYSDKESSPRLVFRGETFKDNDFYEIGEIKAVDVNRYWDGNGTYLEDITFNCNPDEGYNYFESEAICRGSICVGLMYGDKNRYDDVINIFGGFDVSVVATNYPVGCKINLFKNLPDISCLDFVKSICYALGGYPYQDADGVIKMQEYSRIIDRIDNNAINDWTDRIVNAVGSNTESVSFNANEASNLNLAKKNYFLMKNDQLDDFGNEQRNDKLDDAYEQGYNCIKIESDLLEEVQTLFTFPFYGGFLWQKGFYGAKKLTHNMLIGGKSVFVHEGYTTNEGYNTRLPMVGQDMWRIASDEKDGVKAYQLPYFEMGEAKPMLFVITPISVPVATFEENVFHVDVETQVQTEYYYELEYTGEHKNYLSARPWNCASDMPKVKGHDVLQELLGSPCLVKETMNLNVMDLATLDIEKPVYLEKYNSFFAIKKIEVSPEGVSKVELIRIPSEILNESVPNSETEE